jgi:hypothetical protein
MHRPMILGLGTSKLDGNPYIVSDQNELTGGN